jgi:trigger factor
VNVVFNKTDELNAILNIQLEPSDYLPEYEKQLKVINKKSKIPGFRPGFVPKGMIEKMYGESVLSDVVTQTASKKLSTYLQEEKLDILGQPMASEQMPPIEAFTKDRTYDFIFDLGLTPHFEIDPSDLGPFNSIKLNADAKMVNEETEQIRKRFGKYDSVEVVADNDIVKLMLKELDEAGAELENGLQKEASFLVSFVKDEATKALLIGAKKEDNLTLNIFNLFNDDHKEMEQTLAISHAAIHDLNTNFSATINDITRTEPAEMNQELWDKVFGQGTCQSQEDFDTKLKADLEGYFESQGNHILEHDITDQLIAKYQVGLPDEFLKRWLKHSHPEQYTDETADEKYAKESNGLRWQLIIEKIQAKYEIQVENEEVREEAYINTRRMFAQYGMAQGVDHLIEDMVKKQLEKEDYFRNMFHNAQNKKVMAKLRELVPVTEQRLDSEEFFNAVRQHNEKHHQHTDLHEHAHEHEHTHE